MLDSKLKSRKYITKSHEKNPDITKIYSPEENYSYYLSKESVRIGRQMANEATEKYIKLYLSQRGTKKIMIPMIKNKIISNNAMNGNRDHKNGPGMIYVKGEGA